MYVASLLDGSACVQWLALTFYQAAIMLWHWQPSKIQLGPESLLLQLAWHQVLHRGVWQRMHATRVRKQHP
jgi:hypothetical protein